MTAEEWIARAGTSAEVRREAEAFVAGLQRAEVLTHAGDVVVARAPGRLDVMGGIADYSGSLVLEWPLADATYVALQRDRQPSLTLASGRRQARLWLEDILSLDYAGARKYFAAQPANHWAAYIAGAFIVLAREHGLEFRDGARILVASTVPEGKGVSSSAALEVAAMTATCAAYGVTLEPRELALLCQKVENLIAGAPCGVMDQMTATLGESGRMLALLCQPAELRRALALPIGLALWGIDSGMRHDVGGAAYATVRAAAFMGHRLLEDLTARRIDYLANVMPEEFATVAERIPERLTGREFLQRYHDSSDGIAVIEPDQVYPVRAATAHPIHEHARAREAEQQLSRFGDCDREAEPYQSCADRLGMLMYESHAGYSACGLGSDRTDEIVTFVRRAGPGLGIYGARVTGGGSGGTVAILARADAGPLVQGIADRCARRWGSSVRVLSGTSSGAAACGVCALSV